MKKYSKIRDTIIAITLIFVGAAFSVLISLGVIETYDKILTMIQ